MVICNIRIKYNGVAKAKIYLLTTYNNVEINGREIIYFDSNLYEETTITNGLEIDVLDDCISFSYGRCLEEFKDEYIEVMRENCYDCVQEFKVRYKELLINPRDLGEALQFYFISRWAKILDMSDMLNAIIRAEVKRIDI